MGFEVRFDLPDDMTDEAVSDVFWSKLIDTVEANRLLIGGGINDFFATAHPRRSATEAQRAALGNWLRAQPEVSNVAISPLVDAWYDTAISPWVIFRPTTRLA